MPHFSQTLAKQHEHCDTLFAAAENAVAEGDWPRAQEQFQAFARDTLHHFSQEDEVLFTAFENRTGMKGGPTFVMRSEHEQMRDAIAAMEQALQARDGQRYLGLSETLLMLMRQHNLKEENILYPMMDQALADEADRLLSGM
ncbi:MAG TPA: hemerythrin domain-containing protein [Thiobacillaceae bacterium]|nr:hemerythrin domain-containing protein [Thiobacillaceae bacterium]HNU62906.1 hemerythrin domain-containing protein [Thiobacillaceae bacterium]